MLHEGVCDWLHVVILGDGFHEIVDNLCERTAFPARRYAYGLASVAHIVVALWTIAAAAGA